MIKGVTNSLKDPCFNTAFEKSQKTVRVLDKNFYIFYPQNLRNAIKLFFHDVHDCAIN